MSLLSIGKGLLSAVGAGISGVVDEVIRIIDVIIHIRDFTLGTIQDGIDLFEEIKGEVDAIVHFKFVVGWKTRVVSVPRMFDNIQQLIAIPGTIVDAVRDLIVKIRTRFTTLEAAEAVEQVIPGLGQAAGIITAIAEVLVLIKGAIADLKTVVDAIQTVRQDIENLNAIFLQNTNPRKVEKLAAGGSIKIRVGSLHTAS